jgi:general secretion pathway protein K
MRRERGIALIQVLLVTGIIALLMLQMGLTAREQVARAQALVDRAEVQLAAQSRESALLYTLLTEPRLRIPDSENPYVAAWNFHGEPFTVDGITFSIQDESGRMRVPLLDSRDFESMLHGMGVEPDRAKILGRELLTLQGAVPIQRVLGEKAARQGSVAPGRYPLQDLSELRLLPSMDEELYRRLRPLLTLYPTPGFNPLTARSVLLHARMTKSQVTGVVDARGKGALDAGTLWKLTGAQADEETVLLPGPGLTVHLEMELRGRRAVRTTTVSVRPYTSEPLGVWQRSTGRDRDNG